VGGVRGVLPLFNYHSPDELILSPHLAKPCAAGRPYVPLSLERRGGNSKIPLFAPTLSFRIAEREVFSRVQSKPLGHICNSNIK